MDPATLLLMVVIGVIAASQLMHYAGRWIMHPAVFWPVQSLLMLALGLVAVMPFPGWPRQIRTPVRVFLGLFLVWRLVQNTLRRERVARRLEEERREALARRRTAGDD